MLSDRYISATPFTDSSPLKTKLSSHKDLTQAMIIAATEEILCLNERLYACQDLKLSHSEVI